jgi:hypothetical protein
MKVCARCKESKSVDNFHKSSRAKDGLQGRCKSCNNASAREWQDANPEKYEKIWRGQYSNPRRRATKYGLTVPELAELLEENNGLCKICNRSPVNWLVVDHCHTTGEVRGALCEKCNQSLGLMNDNPE